VLDPTIEVRYRPRGSLPAVWRQYLEYGLWKVPVMRKHRRALSLRSLAPLAFVASLAALGAAAPASRAARGALVAECALYATASLGFAVLAVRGRDEPLALVPRVAAVFPAFHVGYGTGMARGWIDALVSG
jgi:succinoglycan biosynthesis protein ExoA